MKLGIFGGTFDPIHDAHLFVAECVFARESLDRVLFVPVADPAHRTTHAPAADRAAMVRLAIVDNGHFEVDDTALQQKGPAYTADTLKLMREKYRSDKFYFIVGADSLVRSVWRRLDEVMSQVEKFVIVSRSGIPGSQIERTLEAVPKALHARVATIDVPPLDISATVIRERVAGALPIRYLTPDSVLDYIATKGLYRNLVQPKGGE